MARGSRWCAAFLLILPLLWPAAAGAADAPAKAPVFYCPRADTAPVIDGKLDDPAWAAAPVRYPLRPGDLPPLHPCEVRMLWDAEALYVAFDALDQDVRSALTARDALLYEDGDVFEFFLLLPGDKTRKIELEVNPNNAFLDILHAEGLNFEAKRKWNWEGAQWKIETRGTLNDDARDAGWSAELRLPWKGLADLGVAAAPEGLAGAKVLFLTVDRIRADAHRLSREQCLWPCLSQMKLTLHDEYAPLRLVEPPAGGAVEGFQRLVDGHCRRQDSLFVDYRGFSPQWEFDTEMPDAVLIWESRPLPRTLPERVAISFVGQAQSDAPPDAPERAGFELLVNGRRCALFTPYTSQDRLWEGGESQLAFKHRAGKFWPSGLYTATVPAAWVKAGEPARLEVRRAAKGPRTRFMLKAWTDAVLYEQLHYGVPK
jgi:hypothetical protein